MKLEVNTTMVCVYTIDDPAENNGGIPTPDVRSNKPIGFHDQADNTTAFFQKTLAADFDGRQVSIAIPNEISISLSVSKKSLIRAKKIKKLLLSGTKSKDTIYDEDVKHVYDFIEEIQTSAVFAYRAVEAFCNASIPETYVYITPNSKGVVEHYGKNQIERWVPTSDKVSKIIPEILSCPSPAQEKFWSDFKKLEEIRNEIIHSKSSTSAKTLTQLLSVTTERYIKSSAHLLNYFIKLDSSNPIFPLGFGKSTIKTISVPDVSEYLQKI